MNLSRLKRARQNAVEKIGRGRLNRLAGRMCRMLGVDPLDVAFEARGIGKFENFERSGELYFLDRILQPHLTRCSKEIPVLIEIGANTGNYTLELQRIFPSVKIHALEPGKAAFEVLSKRFKDTMVDCHHVGCGHESGTLELFTYKSESDSEHASLFRDVFADIHGEADVVSTSVKIVTLDEFCRTRQIEHCHFLKIDTEGNEMDVLRGAKNLLERDAIDAIQFEFNSMNVVSRVFLRDFYELLTGYDLFRLDTKRLIPLPSYDSRNELFAFQNLVALRHDRF